MLKKGLASGILLMTLVLSMVPNAFAAEVPQTDESNDIHVSDYMEFYNNQDEYYSLAKEGYRIVIDVPDQYENLEEARLEALANDAAENDSLEPSQSRGTMYPTKSHDIIKDGMYFFEGATSNYPLYTNYYFDGDYGYRANFHNRSSTYELIYRDIYFTPGSIFNPGGDIEYGKYYRVGLNQTVIDYFSTDSTKQGIFFEFLNPCTFEGWIAHDD